MGIQGGYTGVGTGGVLPSYRARKVPGTAERAPEGPQGLEWVVPGAWARVLQCSAAGRALYHPAGPVRHPGAFPVQDPCKCRLLANKGEI